MAQVGQLRFDGGQPSVTPVMLGVPRVSLGQRLVEAVEVPFAALHLPGGARDVALEAFDVFECGGPFVAAMTAHQREGANAGQPFVGGVEPVLGPIALLLGGVKQPLGSLQFTAAIRWRASEDGPVLGPFVEEAPDALGVVVGSEAGVGDTEEGIEDFPVGGALVGEDAAVVDGGEAGDVPVWVACWERLWPT